MSFPERIVITIRAPLMFPFVRESPCVGAAEFAAFAPRLDAPPQNETSSAIHAKLS